MRAWLMVVLLASILLGWPAPFLLAGTAPAPADHIVLTNGDRLTGAVTELDGERLQMKTALAGEVTVAWPAITVLSTARPLAVTLADEQVVVGRLATRNGEIEIHTETAVITVTKDAVRALRSLEAQARYEGERQPGWLDLWEGTADAGLSSTSGNSDIATVTLGLNAQRESPTDKLSAFVNSLFTRDSTGGTAETIANTVRGGARYKRSFKERWFTFEFTDLEFDELQRLDLRWVLGGGLGWRPRKTPRTLLELFAGGSFNQEYFQQQPVRRTGEALAGEELSYKLMPRTTLRERLSLFPNLSEPGEYRVNLDASLETRLNHWLSWHLTLSNRFLSNPPPATQKNDLLVTTGIRIAFGAVAR